MFEIVCDQESTTVRVRALKNSYARILRHVGVLKVWVDHPMPVAVSVEEVIDLLVVQKKRRGERGLRVRPSIPACHKRQRI